jgi:hypothetical protein
VVTVLPVSARSSLSGRQLHSPPVRLSAPVRAVPLLAAGQRSVTNVAGCITKNHRLLLLQGGGTNLGVDDRVRRLLVEAL